MGDIMLNICEKVKSTCSAKILTNAFLGTNTSSVRVTSIQVDYFLAKPSYLFRLRSSDKMEPDEQRQVM